MGFTEYSHLLSVRVVLDTPGPQSGNFGGPDRSTRTPIFQVCVRNHLLLRAYDSVWLRPCGALRGPITAYVFKVANMFRSYCSGRKTHFFSVP